MADYIDREALREILDGWRDAHADVDDIHGCGLLEDVICEVDAQPAADVAPVTYGEWIEDDYGYNRCSTCGWEWDEPESVSPYCPHCGAKMEEDEIDG